MPYLIGKMFPATVATVKCPSDLNICGHSYNCLTFKWKNLTVTQCTKTEELFSVRKAIFLRNPYILFCVSLCLLGKILLVSRIQTAFARRKWYGYARLGKMDFQCPVCAVWKTSFFTERLLWMQRAFAFRLFLPKRKAFADIHRNVGLVRSIMIRQKRSLNCNKPVITWPLGRLSNLSPSGDKLASALVAM